MKKIRIIEKGWGDSGYSLWIYVEEEVKD